MGTTEPLFISSKGTKMPLFKDKKGGEWDLTITLGAAERVDDSDFSALTKEKFSMLEPGKELFNLLISKPRILFAVIWAIVSPQSKVVLGLDATDPAAQGAFADRMDGAVITAARKAFFEALGDFFPDQRTALSQLIQKWEQGRAILEKELEGLDSDMTKYLTSEIKGNVEDFRLKMEQETEERERKRQETRKQRGEKSSACLPSADSTLVASGGD